MPTACASDVHILRRSFMQRFVLCRSESACGGLETCPGFLPWIQRFYARYPFFGSEFVPCSSSGCVNPGGVAQRRKSQTRPVQTVQLFESDRMDLPALFHSQHNGCNYPPHQPARLRLSSTYLPRTHLPSSTTIGKHSNMHLNTKRRALDQLPAFKEPVCLIHPRGLLTNLDPHPHTTDLSYAAHC